MSSTTNPFVEDIEGRQTRRPRAGCFAKCVPQFCTVLFGALGFVVFIYILAVLDPLKLSDWKSSKRSVEYEREFEPYDVRRPVRRWPATESTNAAERSVNKPVNSTTIGEIPHGPPMDFVTPPNRTEPATIDPFRNIDYPNIPPAALCMSRMMKQEEYDEKQLYCRVCWQNVHDNSTTLIQYFTFAKSEEEFRYKCHSRCFVNYDFQSCAIHLYASYYDSQSARNCTYCKQATREALGVDEKLH